MELLHQLEQNLSQQQLQSLNLLLMNETELEQFVREQSMENPVIDVEEYSAVPDMDRPLAEQLERWEWLKNSDYQNRTYYPEEEEQDPFAFAAGRSGMEETLETCLCNQIDILPVDGEYRLLLFFLAKELDEDGYLRESAAELAQVCGSSREKLENAVRILQKLEPAGVGACSLAERLRLQLERKNASATAIKIVREHLEDLAHGRIHRIQTALQTDRNSILQAQTEILALQPHIGSLFESREKTAYIQPDVYIEADRSGLTACMAREGHPFFTVNHYYLSLYRTTEDPAVRAYLKEKLSQADSLRYFIGQREKTILRLVRLILEKQAAFFTEGDTALKPFTMAEAAGALGLHPSTVTRTVKNKYIQCPRGLYPLRYFFEKGIGTDKKAETGCRQVKARIREYIETENLACPLSDQTISERLKAGGFDISRRTVAKYREEMHIAGSPERRRG